MNPMLCDLDIDLEEIASMSWATACRSVQAGRLFAYEPISRAIALVCERFSGDVGIGKPSYTIVEEQVRAWMVHLVQDHYQKHQTVSLDDAIMLAKRKVAETIEVAVRENRKTPIEDAAVDSARSYRNGCRRRDQSAGSNSEKEVRYGCEEDDEMRHKKAAWNLTQAKSLVGDHYVKDAYGRFVPYEWKRHDWPDEMGSDENS